MLPFLPTRISFPLDITSLLVLVAKKINFRIRLEKILIRSRKNCQHLISRLVFSTSSDIVYFIAEKRKKETIRVIEEKRNKQLSVI